MDRCKSLLCLKCSLSTLSESACFTYLEKSEQYCFLYPADKWDGKRPTGRKDPKFPFKRSAMATQYTDDYCYCYNSIRVYKLTSVVKLNFNLRALVSYNINDYYKKSYNYDSLAIVYLGSIYFLPKFELNVLTQLLRYSN